MSRPTKLTPTTIRLLVEAIKMGATYDLAAQYAGISSSTLYSWMAKGRSQDGGEFVELLEEIKRAEGKGALANLALIQKCAKDGDWKASAWILERRHGYNKAHHNKQAEQAVQEIQTQNMNTKDILEAQLRQTLKASQEALNVGSYQAFASLQRQVVNTALQIKVIEAEPGADNFEEYTDEDLLEQITNIVTGLPPILRQRLQADLQGLTKGDISVIVKE